MHPLSSAAQGIRPCYCNPPPPPSPPPLLLQPLSLLEILGPAVLQFDATPWHVLEAYATVQLCAVHPHACICTVTFLHPLRAALRQSCSCLVFMHIEGLV